MTVVTNSGTADFWPIFHVHGAVNEFSITNNSVVDGDGNPLVILYNPLPIPTAIGIPLGDYAVIDCFQNRIWLNSSGFDLADGLVMEWTDFFPLAPGTNDIVTTGGASIEILMHHAWA